jgi:hypothetical protein
MLRDHELARLSWQECVSREIKEEAFRVFSAAKSDELYEALSAPANEESDVAAEEIRGAVMLL